VRRERDGGTPFGETAADFAFLLHAAGYLPREELRALCDAIAPAIRGKPHSPRQQQVG